MVSWCKKGAYNAQTCPKSELSGSSGQTLTTNVAMTLCVGVENVSETFSAQMGPGFHTPNFVEEIARRGADGT